MDRVQHGRPATAIINMRECDAERLASIRQWADREREFLSDDDWLLFLLRLLDAAQSDLARLKDDLAEQRGISEGYRGAYERVLGDVERANDKEISLLDELARLRSPTKGESK